MNQAKLFRILLLGLPVGLVLTTGISLYYNFNKKDKKAEPTSRVDSKSREFVPSAKSINEPDLRLFTQRLSGDIGARNTNLPKSLRQSVSFISGLLGPNNFGFGNVVLVSDEASPDLVKISLKFEGRRRPQELVRVSTSYLSEPLSPGAHGNASGVAVLLALAQAWVGSEPERSLELVFLPFPAESSISQPKALAEGTALSLNLHLDGLGGAPAALLPNQAAVRFSGNALAKDSLATFPKFFSENAALQASANAESAVHPFLGAATAAGVPCLVITDAVGPQQPAISPLVDTVEQINFPVLTEIARGLQRALETVINPSKSNAG